MQFINPNTPQMRHHT